MNLTDLFYFGIVLLIIFGVFAGLWFIGGYLLAHSVDQKYRACPSCEKKGAGIIVDTEVERISSQIDRSKLTPFRVTRENVTDHYQCEFCEHTWDKTFMRENRSPLDGTSNS